MQITTRIGCRNACSYCPQDVLITAYQERSNDFQLSFETFKECLNRIPQQVDIWFAGMCEPWLNPGCTEMLLHAHQQGYKIGVFTTLVGMKLEDVKVLESLPFRFFHVHLPSSRPSEKIAVDNQYLALLDAVSKSRITTTYHHHLGSPSSEVRALLDRNGHWVEPRSVYRRSGNVEVKQRLRLPKKRGAIACVRKSRCNVLLPNGDVLLCSNDYGMEHVLGNLLASTYESLFLGREFTRVIKGQKDGSLNTLCRNCDNFSRNTTLSSKFLNLPYFFDRYLYYLRDTRSVEEFSRLLVKLKRHFLTKLRRRWR